MIHFFMILSGKPELEFQAEVFVRSLEMWGKVNYCLTICQSAQDSLRSPLLRRRADVITFPGDHWQNGLGCVPDRCKTTIYTDTDILICKDLNPMLKQCQDKVGGVIAYGSPRINWNAFGIKWRKMYEHPRGGTCPYYVNLGFVAVPSKYVPALNESMVKYLIEGERLFPGHYHKPQFAMCCSVESLELPRVVLPIQYNQPDMYPKLLDGEPTVMHLLLTKSKVKKWSSVPTYPAKTEPMQLVQQKLQYIQKFIF